MAKPSKSGATNRTLARWIGVVAAAAVIPFLVQDFIQLRLWNVGWDMWAIALGSTALYCAIAYALGWALARIGAWIFTAIRAAL